MNTIYTFNHQNVSMRGGGEHPLPHSTPAPCTFSREKPVLPHTVTGTFAVIAAWWIVDFWRKNRCGGHRNLRVGAEIGLKTVHTEFF